MASGVEEWDALFSMPTPKGPNVFDRAMDNFSDVAHGFVPGLIEMIKAPVHDIGKTFGLADGEYQTDNLISALGTQIKDSPYFNMAFDLNPATMPFTLLDKGPIGLVKDVVSNAEGMWENPGFAALDMATIPMMLADGAGLGMRAGLAGAKAGVPGSAGMFEKLAPLAGYTNKAQLSYDELWGPHGLGGEWGRPTQVDGETVDLGAIGPTPDSQWVRRERRAIPGAPQYTDAEREGGAPLLTPGGTDWSTVPDNSPARQLYDSAAYTSRARNVMAASMGDAMWNAVGKYMPASAMSGMWAKRIVRASSRASASERLAREQATESSIGALLTQMQDLGYTDVDTQDKFLALSQLIHASGWDPAKKGFNPHRWVSRTAHRSETNDLDKRFLAGKNHDEDNGLWRIGVVIRRNKQYEGWSKRKRGDDVTLQEAYDENSKVIGGPEEERPYNIQLRPLNVTRAQHESHPAVLALDNFVKDVQANKRIIKNENGEVTVDASGSMNPLLYYIVHSVVNPDANIHTVSDLMGDARTAFSSDFLFEFKPLTSVIEETPLAHISNAERTNIRRSIAKRWRERTGNQIQMQVSEAAKLNKERGVQRLDRIEAMTRLLSLLEPVLKRAHPVRGQDMAIKQAIIDLFRASGIDLSPEEIDLDALVAALHDGDNFNTEPLVKRRAHRAKTFRANVRHVLDRFERNDPNDDTPVDPVYNHLIASIRVLEADDIIDGVMDDAEVRSAMSRYLTKQMMGELPNPDVQTPYVTFVESIFPPGKAKKVLEAFGHDDVGGKFVSNDAVRKQFHNIADAMSNKTLMAGLFDIGDQGYVSSGIGKTFLASLHGKEYGGELPAYRHVAQRLSNEEQLLSSFMQEAMSGGTLHHQGLDVLKAVLSGYNEELGLFDRMKGAGDNLYDSGIQTALTRAINISGREHADVGAKAGKTAVRRVLSDVDEAIDAVDGSNDMTIDMRDAGDPSQPYGRPAPRHVRENYSQANAVDIMQMADEQITTAQTYLQKAAQELQLGSMDEDGTFIYHTLTKDSEELLRKTAAKMLEADANAYNKHWQKISADGSEVIEKGRQYDVMYGRRVNDDGGGDDQQMDLELTSDGFKLKRRNKKASLNNKMHDKLMAMLIDFESGNSDPIKLMEALQGNEHYINYLEKQRELAEAGRVAALRLANDSMHGSASRKVEANRLALAEVFNGDADKAYYIPLKADGHAEQEGLKKGGRGRKDINPDTSDASVQYHSNYLERLLEGRFDINYMNSLNSYKRVMDLANEQDTKLTYAELFGQKMDKEALIQGRKAGVVGLAGDGTDTPWIEFPDPSDPDVIKLTKQMKTVMALVQDWMTNVDNEEKFRLRSIISQMVPDDLLSHLVLNEDTITRRKQLGLPDETLVIPRDVWNGYRKEIEQAHNVVLAMFRKFSDLWKPMVLHMRPFSWIRNNLVGSAMFLSMASNPIAAAKYVTKYMKGRNDLRKGIDSVEARSYKAIIDVGPDITRAHRQGDVLKSKQQRELRGGGAVTTIRRGWNRYLEFVGEANAKLADEPFRGARALQILESDRAILEQKLGRPVSLDEASRKLLSDARYKSDLLENVLGDLVDFTGMTNFERQYIATLFPFWSWIRGSAIAMQRRMANDPEAIFAMSQISQMGADENEADFGNVPDFVKSWVDVGLPGGKLISTGGMNPFATPFDVASMATQMIPGGMSYRQFGSDNPMSSINPLALNMVESLTGKDMYFGTPLGNKAPGTQFMQNLVQLPITQTIGQLADSSTGARATTTKSRMNTIAGQLGIPIADPRWSAVYARAKDEGTERYGYNPYIGHHPESISGYNNQYAATIPWAYR